MTATVSPAPRKPRRCQSAVIRPDKFSRRVAACPASQSASQMAASLRDAEWPGESGHRPGAIGPILKTAKADCSIATLPAWMIHTPFSGRSSAPKWPTALDVARTSMHSDMYPLRRRETFHATPQEPPDSSSNRRTSAKKFSILYVKSIPSPPPQPYCLSLILPRDAKRSRTADWSNPENLEKCFLFLSDTGSNPNFPIPVPKTACLYNIPILC